MTFFSFNLSASNIDLYLTTPDGCVWHIKGTTDVSFDNNGVASGNYSITLESECGNYRFTGNSYTISESELMWNTIANPIDNSTPQMSSSNKAAIHWRVIDWCQYEENF